MRARCIYEIELTVRSPFLFRGLANSMLGVDAAQLRDEDDNPVIPSDQIRGVLKEALQDLKTAAPALVTEKQISDLFGNPSPAHDSKNDEWDRPDRGILFFSDLIAEVASSVTEEITRIEIDDSTGATKTGHVQVIELVSPLGAEVTFKGEILAFCSSAPGGPPEQAFITEARSLEQIFQKALQVARSVGAFKSVGFGEIVHGGSRIYLKEEELRVLHLPNANADPDRRRAYWVTFDRPLLVDAARVSDNTFLGSAVVPGAVFKGALAERLRYAGNDPEKGVFAAALSSLHVSHAWPESADGRVSGHSLPLSLIGLKTDKGSPLFGDALSVGYNEGAMIAGKAAFFGPDWKEELHAGAAKLFGQAQFDEPIPLPRTHTAIETRGIAAEAQLFTTVARSVRRPKNWSNPGLSRRWLLVVDGNQVEPDKLASLFALFDEGLGPLGKTGALARFERAEDIFAQPVLPAPVHGTANCFAIVLKTPALMVDPRAGGDVKTQYEQYFAAQCVGARLKNFYAAQRFGGRYQAMRRRPYGNSYYPFILTEPGSVFLLEAENSQIEKIQKKLNDFVCFGLPLPQLEGVRQLSWRNCPFVRENGFGEITANYLSTPSQAALLKAVTNV